MEEVRQQELQISKASKITFNLLEIRLFDLSQALQVTGHKFSINQIKQSLEKQHNIFAQSEKIFEDLKIHPLYGLMKQMTQNYTSIASIVIDKMESDIGKKGYSSTNSTEQTSKGVETKRVSKSISNENLTSIPELPQSSKEIKSGRSIPRLGGVALFNENYCRGIESAMKKLEATGQKRKKIGEKERIRQLITNEINEISDVEKIYDNDEISKFIKEGRVKHELFSHIEYEKDLESIAKSLKQSQDDALKFLSESNKLSQKSPLDKEETEEELIINYHELLQLLEQKRKQEYQMVQRKIKEMMEGLRVRNTELQEELDLKCNYIEELLRSQKKPTKEFGTQTTKMLGRSNYSPGDPTQTTQEQHEIVVNTLKRELDKNQKSILELETDKRAISEKLKKKESQLGEVSSQLQKLKAEVKNQVFKRGGRRRNSMISHDIDDKEIELIEELDEATAGAQGEIYGNSKGGKKRNRYSTMGAKSINTGKSLRRDASSNSLCTVDESRKLSSYRNHRESIMSYNQGDSGSHNGSGPFGQTQTSNFSRQKHQVNTEGDDSSQMMSMSQIEQLGEDRMKELNYYDTSSDQRKKSSSPRGSDEEDSLQESSMKEESGQIESNTGKVAQARGAKGSYHSSSLLDKNSELLYQILFSNTSREVDLFPPNKGQEKKELREIIQRFNQASLFRRLSKIKAFLFKEVELDEIQEEEAMVSDDQQNSEESKGDNKGHTRKHTTEQPDSSAQHSGTKSTTKKSTPKRQDSPAKPSVAFLKKLHKQIRVSGHGLNLNRLEFLELCDSVERQISKNKRKKGSNFSNESTAKQDYNEASQSDSQYPQSRKTLRTLKKIMNQERREKGMSIEDKNAESNISNLQVQGVGVDQEGSLSLKQSEATKLPSLYSLQNEKAALCPNGLRKNSVTSSLGYIHNLVPEHSLQESILSVENKQQRSKQLKELYRLAKGNLQGSSMNADLLENLFDKSMLSNSDILKITQLLKQKPNCREQLLDILNTTEPKCSHSNAKILTTTENQLCVHFKRFEAFIARLAKCDPSIGGTNNFSSRVKRDVFNLHIQNIDGEKSSNYFPQSEIKRKSRNSHRSSSGAHKKDSSFLVDEGIIQKTSNSVYQSSYTQKSKLTEQSARIKKPFISVHAPTLTSQENRSASDHFGTKAASSHYKLPKVSKLYRS